MEKGCYGVNRTGVRDVSDTCLPRIWMKMNRESRVLSRHGCFCGKVFIVTS